MKYLFNDGGRAAAGYKGLTGDCACRAIAIITEKEYKQVYKDLFALLKIIGEKSPRHGCRDLVCRIYLWWNGFKYVSCKSVVYFRSDELPPGRLIVRMHKHMAAVIDGVLHDTHDCSGGGVKFIYGYYCRRRTLRESLFDIWRGLNSIAVKGVRKWT